MKVGRARRGAPGSHPGSIARRRGPREPPTKAGAKRAERHGKGRRAPVTEAMGNCGGQADCQSNTWGKAATTQQVDLKLRVEKLNVTMVPGVAGAGEGPSPPKLPVKETKEDREERILAMLGIVGTILNLLVIIFVYIYTTI